MQLPTAPDLPVRTERTCLRAFRAQDLDALLAFHSDAESVRFVPFGPRDRAGTAEVLARKAANTVLREQGDLLELAVTTAQDDTVVGDVLLALRSVEHETLEVGYLFSPTVAGRGLATEAVGALLGVAFHRLGARRVVARVDERNTRSRRLLERLGLRQEAVLVENEWLKGELTTEVDYAVLAREWSRPTPAG